jgi:hypothetical protein
MNVTTSLRDLIHLIRYILTDGRLGDHNTARASPSSPAGVIPFCGRHADMDRQQLMALFFAFLMVSSMVAYGVSLL